jgi:peptide/nickel transport system substrate-binding protein
MNMGKNMKLLMVVLVLLTFGFTIHIGSPIMAQEKPKSGGTLIIAMEADIENLDPLYSGGPSMRVWCNMYEPLIGKDKKGNLIPLLADKWERVDATHWKFHIREGVKFHSGNPCDAKAVEASYERMHNPQKPHNHYAFSKWIKSVKALDKNWILMETAYPFSGTLDYLTSSMCAVICDAKQVEKYGDLMKYPSGTGPFVFDKWELGQYVQLKRNENYWGGKPYIEYLKFRFMPEDATRVMALRRGEVDIVFKTSVAMVNDIRKDPNVTVYKYPYLRVNAMEFNLSKPIVNNNPEVRKAITYAIDTKSITKDMIGEIGRVADSIVLDISPGHVSAGFPVYNPEKAKEILAMSGWKDVDNDGVLERGNEKLEFEFYTDYTRDYRNREVAQAIQDYLKKIGVKINLNIVMRGPYVDIVVNKLAHDLCIMGWQVPTNEPDWAIYTRFHSDFQKPGGWGTPCTRRADIDYVLFRARTTTDPQERLQLFGFMQQMLFTENLILPLYYVNELSSVRKRVQNFMEHPEEMFSQRYAKVWLK